MAAKSKKSGPGAKSGGGIFLRRAAVSLALIFAFALGALLANLDRMGSVPYLLLRHKQLLPRIVRQALPGETAQPGTARTGEKLAGKIISVHDGDTATLLAGDKKYTIRFYGIDAPETTQPRGAASGDALSQKILGENVQVEVVTVDRYQRCVGRVKLNGRDINLEMIAGGHAWYYSDFANDSTFAAAEREAKAAQKGLWSQKSPEPPWLYRKRKQLEAAEKSYQQLEREAGISK